MSQSYKGLTIPSYSDTADAPAAFQGFVDSGPIPRFTDSTARDAAIVSPVEGMMCYLTGSDELQIYNGASWGSAFVKATGDTMSGDLNMGSNQITALGNPATDTDAVSRGYMEMTVEFAKPGTLSTQTGASRWYPPYNISIVDVSASVGTAPTGSSLIVDVNKNGSTIFTTQSNRPTIAVSTVFDVSGTPNVTSLTGDTDYLTVDIDQVGSTTAGADLVVQVRYKRA